MRRLFELSGAMVVVATMHGKERVIAPVLSRLGAGCIVPGSIDTDRFGTFTRDVARTGLQRDALLAKAREGLRLAPDADFAVASEGSVGPHPGMPFIAGGLEMVGLVARDGYPVVGYHLTTRTNYASTTVRSLPDAEAFARRVLFPSHSLVVMESAVGPLVEKGIRTRARLISVVGRALEVSGSVHLEADMRAHCNPTRMAAMELATVDLVRRLETRCPVCDWPDYVARCLPGRPCEMCGLPTAEAWLERRSCRACGRVDDRIDEPDRQASPGACGHCNP